MVQQHEEQEGGSNGQRPAASQNGASAQAEDDPPENGHRAPSPQSSSRPGKRLTDDQVGALASCAQTAIRPMLLCHMLRQLLRLGVGGLINKPAQLCCPTMDIDACMMTAGSDQGDLHVAPVNVKCPAVSARWPTGEQSEQCRILWLLQCRQCWSFAAQPFCKHRNGKTVMPALPDNRANCVFATATFPVLAKHVVTLLCRSR